MRVIIYDNTDLSRSIDVDNDGKADFQIPSLSLAWWAGAKLFKTVGRFEVAVGVGSWDEFFDKLLEIGKYRRISEIQFWGHGWFGSFYINGVAANSRSLGTDRRWSELRAVMTTRPLWWFRTCCTFGTAKGKDFAERWSHFFKGPVAGHSAIIGTWGVHSHGHLLNLGDAHWGDDDGLDKKGQPVNSNPWLPNTISCLHSNVPTSWGTSNANTASDTKHGNRDA